MKLDKKKLIVAAVVFVLLIGLVVGLAIGLGNKKSKVVFYGLPESLNESLGSYLQKSGGKFDVTVLGEEDGLSVSDAKKYDAIFTWNGAVAENFAKSAKEMPDAIYRRMPTSVRSSGKVDNKNLMVPILFDYVPIYVSKKAGAFENDMGPESIAELENCLAAEKGNFDFAMLCGGVTDPEFYGFLSMVAESMLGGDGYKNLCARILEKKSFREVLDEVVSKSSDGVALSLRSVLDTIVSWQRSGLIQQQWYRISENDLFMLMERQSFCVGSMFLDYYRKLPRRVSYNYSPYRFPVMDPKMDHGVIASEVVMIAQKQNKSLKKLADFLTKADTQEELSNLTTLSPVHSQAGAYDGIADDGRFYSAASKYGPLPTLDRAAFTSRDTANAFAQEARDFLLLGN